MKTQQLLSTLDLVLSIVIFAGLEVAAGALLLFGIRDDAMTMVVAGAAIGLGAILFATFVELSGIRRSLAATLEMARAATSTETSTTSMKTAAARVAQAAQPMPAERPAERPPRVVEKDQRKTPTIIHTPEPARAQTTALTAEPARKRASERFRPRRKETEIIPQAESSANPDDAPVVDLPTCPHCRGNVSHFGSQAGRKRYYCRKCKITTTEPVLVRVGVPGAVATAGKTA